MWSLLMEIVRTNKLNEVKNKSCDSPCAVLKGAFPFEVNSLLDIGSRTLPQPHKLFSWPSLRFILI